jgi:signal transduction histidine kinase
MPLGIAQLARRATRMLHQRVVKERPISPHQMRTGVGVHEQQGENTHPSCDRANVGPSEHQLRELSARMEAICEVERIRIAHEIHDELGSLLTALKLELSGCAARAGEGGAFVERYGSIMGLVNDALSSVKRIATQLRPPILDQFGLWEALKYEARQFQERLGIACCVTMPAEPPQPANEVATAILRIVEETLTNVARHANATRVDILVAQNADQILIEVRDNGKGITKAQVLKAESLGLLGMHERARRCGGHFRIVGTPGLGTIATLFLPSGEICEA